MSSADARTEARYERRIEERSKRAHEEAPRGSGWLVFAGAMLLILGSVNVIMGIAAISNSKFFVNDAKFVIGNLNAWGWIMLLVGAAQLLTAFGVLANNRGAAWAGVAFASVNAIAQLLWISSYPFLALALFSLDILVIYGLVVYGGRVRDSA